MNVLLDGSETKTLVFDTDVAESGVNAGTVYTLAARYVPGTDIQDGSAIIYFTVYETGSPSTVILAINAPMMASSTSQRGMPTVLQNF